MPVRPGLFLRHRLDKLSDDHSVCAWPQIYPRVPLVCFKCSGSRRGGVSACESAACAAGQERLAATDSVEEVRKDPSF
jgi:hypothetical protein